MKQLSRKTKSDIIFWSMLLLFMAYLFLTPSGGNTRAWLSSLTLTSPSNVAGENQRVLKEDWQLNSTNGEEVWLSQYKKPIFINIWATWCPPCRAELPSIFKLEEKYKGKVEFLLISPDESLAKLKKFGVDKDYKTVFYNASGATPKELVTGSYPTTYIIDSNKKIILKSVGAHNWNSEEVHKILDQLIKDV